MPEQTQQAVDWALQQVVIFEDDQIQVSKDTPLYLVDKVREYFNTNGVEYSTFSFDDLIEYLPEEDPETEE